MRPRPASRALRPTSALRLAGLAVPLLALSLFAQPPAPEQEPLPRFRGGTNLVRLDAYVSADGAAVADLTADDFEVFEDDQPQAIENFEFIRARGDGVAVQAGTQPTSVSEQLDAARDPSARVFVIFLDTWHVSVGGSARSGQAIAEFLDRVVGPNDLVGVMTPDITPQNMTLVRRGDGIDRMLRDVWAWGQRDQRTTNDPREEAIRQCYAERGATDGIAREMIERRREQRTLRAVDAMTSYLGDLREERKFVVLLSEGWQLFGRNDTLGRPLAGSVPGSGTTIGVGPGGRLTDALGNDQAGLGYESCERERVMLAYIDHQLEVRQLAQRANRANVSFYPIDPRGLVVFDEPIGGSFKPLPPGADAQRLSNRQDGLRTLAEQTDGAWSLNTNDVPRALARMLADTNSYYLLSYYSSNAKLDGRFRRITVKVKSPDMEVRARPGYLAPTEAEARAAGAVTASGPGGGPSRPAIPAAVSRALGEITPVRGTTPMRVQAVGLGDRIRTVIELDAATVKQPEWQSGGTLQVSIEPEGGGAPTVIEADITPGQRSLIVEGPEDGLPPGRYMVRVEGRSRGAGRLRASTDATIAAPGSRLGAGVSALRRGPATGLAYQPTADSRYRRTERIRLEVPLLVTGAIASSGRVLTREGQPLPLQVVMSERTDEATTTRFLVADVTLAPLAQGDYVLEVAAGPESVTYGFRIVP
jgi:VWFA-related protein